MDDPIVDLKPNNVIVDLNHDNPFVDVKHEIYEPVVNSSNFTANFTTFKNFKCRDDLLNWVREETIKLRFVTVINKSDN